MTKERKDDRPKCQKVRVFVHFWLWMIDFFDLLIKSCTSNYNLLLFIYLSFLLFH